MRSVAFFLTGAAVGAVALYVYLMTSDRIVSQQIVSAAPPRPESPVAAAPAAAGEPKSAPGGSLVDAPIVLPIVGLTAADLRDSFEEGRAGHKHEAIDIMKPRGTPVVAVVDGDIAKLFNSKLGGLTIYQFDDAKEYCYYYAHLDRYAEGISEGQRVRRGQIIGHVGSTGDASPEAPHLHFTIFKLGPEKRWWEGTAINPYPVLRSLVR